MEIALNKERQVDKRTMKGRNGQAKLMLKRIHIYNTVQGCDAFCKCFLTGLKNSLPVFIHFLVIASDMISFSKDLRDVADTYLSQESSTYHFDIIQFTM